MDYFINFKGNEYKLPLYNLKVAEKLEKISSTYYSDANIMSKAKDIYNFASDLIGKDEIVNAIGKLADLDLNELDIVYMEIIDCYSRPLSEYKQEKTSEKIEESQVDKVIELVRAIPQLKDLNKIK